MSGSLHDAFLDELRDAFDAEKQITRALPRVAKAASSPQLRAAFEQHIQETKAQVERLTRVFESLGEKPRGKHCDGMAGILEEAKSALEEETEDATMDALLIASAQRVEHYEMAAYGTLVAWAEAMGHDEAARLLRETLDEEKATDEKLTAIAEGGINRDAASSSTDDESEAEEAQAEPQGRSATGGRRATGTGASGRTVAAATTRGGGRSTSRSTTSRTSARGAKATGARKR
ncbi:ferritin-like domain-containing protein [Luteitalea sp. TBR-22]|uniref:YciE/YciF ferroxidase family protein n=1 Tax=Luteitalea sp. TBR-22 TaxID=2802971 RepID=UPI001EF47708|nr:ferritin-like domain-containing protein [Luteitalea sp. TBR-22]